MIPFQNLVLSPNGKRPSSNLVGSISPKLLKTEVATADHLSVNEIIESVIKQYCYSGLQKTEQGKFCGMCRLGGGEDLLTCSSCGLSGHSKCLGCSEALFMRIRQRADWECANCKKCGVCGQHDEDVNLMCEVCDRAIHRLCLDLPQSGKYLLLLLFKVEYL